MLTRGADRLTEVQQASVGVRSLTFYLLGLCSVGTGVRIAVPFIKIDPFSFQSRQRSGCVKPLGRPMKLVGPCQDSGEGRRGGARAL